MNDPLDDPWVAAEIERALAPYVGRLSSAKLDWMREQLLDSLRTETKAADLLRRARPRDVDESGEVARDSSLAGDAPGTNRPVKAG